MIPSHRIVWGQRAFLLFALCISMTSGAWAQSVTQTQSLAFGPFAAGSGGSVTVQSDGVRTAAGGVTLITAAQFGTARAASFTVSNPANGIFTFTIALPASATLTRVGGTETMTVDTFVSNPTTGQDRNKKGFGALTGGTGTFVLGARLVVNSSQTSGSYTGTYSVIVTYP